MKTKIFTTLLAGISTLGVSTSAFAQNRGNLSRSIDDDGRNLSIRVHGTVNGRILDFQKKLDVRGLTTKEKSVLTDRILDSLGVARISYEAKSRRDYRPFVYREDRRSNKIYSSENDVHSNSGAVVASTQNEPQPDAAPVTKSLNKEVWTDDNGFLYIRYKFMRGKDEIIIEKSTEAAGMSESGKKKFFKDFEKELEQPVM
jgi:hypothetical protein